MNLQVGCKESWESTPGISPDAIGKSRAVPDMTLFARQNANMALRPVQYRDIDAIERLVALELEAGNASSSTALVDRELPKVRQWYGPLKFLSLFPNPLQHAFCVYVAEQDNQIKGIIQVLPFNRNRRTWRVERVLVDGTDSDRDIGSMMLRHCFETILEGHTWLLEVNINNKEALALYRQNGFQPLAHMTYWAIAPELHDQLAQREPDLPNLLPVSNADAALLYQLDTVAMPPLVRQVFDRSSQDFKTSFLGAFVDGLKQWFSNTQTVSGYVFEPQRKAAIGHFQVRACRDGSQPHIAHLTVHPAYTWLYPELLSQMARVIQAYPAQALHLASADYQQEREEYLEQLGAERIEHTLLMSRSVWHKLREAKPSALEALQLAEMLQSLQPSRKPIPSRISWLQSLPKNSNVSSAKDLSKSVSPPPANAMSEDAAPPPELPNVRE